MLIVQIPTPHELLDSHKDLKKLQGNKYECESKIEALLS